MKVYSKEQAWEEANKIFPTDYEYDAEASERAGHPIYWSTVKGKHIWISDLGCRLEVNLENCNSVNIYIVETEEVKELNKTVAELKEQVRKLEADLEKEMEWKPFEDEHNIPQERYENLANNSFTKELTDEEAKDIISKEFGFDTAKIRICRSVSKTEINRHRYLRKVGEYERKPLYAASDWNYIRFDVAGWCYEMYGSQLSQFYC